MSTALASAMALTTGGPGRRRRAWWRAGCVLLAVAIYLNVWTVYAVYGLTDYGRFVQQPPGAPVTAMGAEFRLTGLVQTDVLVDSVTDEVVPAPQNAVWLVARVDVVRQTEDPDLLCSFQALGPQRRIWTPGRVYVSREAESTCSLSEMPLGQPYPLELVFQVPEAYVDDLAGIVVNDPASRAARPVLVPPS